MNAIEMTPSMKADENVAAFAPTPSNPQPEIPQRERIPEGVQTISAGTGMSDAMRTIVWVTGVAFGVFAPGAFAQNIYDTGATQKNSAFQKLDANHDGFVSREEARTDPAVEAVFSQADMNKDGKLDEDELIKALSISQRETVAKTAVDGVSAARQYAADSEITAEVKSALLRAEGLRSLDVSVQTYKGKVQLAGFVDDKVQIAQAGKVAASASGVKSVLNDLTVK